MRTRKLYEDVLDDIDEIRSEAEEEEWVPEPGWEKSFIWFMWDSASKRAIEKYAEKFSHYLEKYAERFRMKTFSEEESGRIVDMFKRQRFAPDRSIIVVQFDVPRDVAAKLYITLLACGPGVPYGFFVNSDGFLERDGCNLTTLPAISRKLLSGTEELEPHVEHWLVNRIASYAGLDEREVREAVERIKDRVRRKMRISERKN